MTKKKPRKPTLKEMEKVISQIIKMVEHLRVRISDLEYVTQSYHEWKNEKEKFTKYLHEQVEKFAKDRNRKSVSDNGQQKVSESVQSSNSWK